MVALVPAIIGLASPTSGNGDSRDSLLFDSLDLADMRRVWQPSGSRAGWSHETPDLLVTEPMLGRPTDTSIDINVIGTVAIDIYAEFGMEPGVFPEASGIVENVPPREPVEIKLVGLTTDMTYHYRLMCRHAGSGGDFVPAARGRFRTQRAPGSPFTFTIQADSHIIPGINAQKHPKMRLYEVTIANVYRDLPDFHIDMGDFAHIEYYAGRRSRSLNDALERYMIQRHYLSTLSHLVPFYLVIGNHEAEQGWRIDNRSDSLEIWGTVARKAVIPNPYPDGFYSGSGDSTECCGLRENYYAWEWGDALFVVLDPFWYTTTQPHQGGGYSPSLDGWDWTLGKQQYEWLYDTLRQSNAEWKLVFSHHMTGGALTGRSGINPYGRGGIDAAKFSVAGRPSFEWGGEDSTGEFVFHQKRPGWTHGPIHDLMADLGVDLFFHGHDHCFVREELDGITYQTCPSPADPTYHDGLCLPYFYSTGRMIYNSGHLRVTVSPDSITVEYVRSVLPEDEPLAVDDRTVRNGDVFYSYTISR
jgi:hypothetical protein